MMILKGPIERGTQGLRHGKKINGVTQATRDRVERLKYEMVNGWFRYRGNAVWYPDHCHSERYYVENTAQVEAAVTTVDPCGYSAKYERRSLED
jgi:hypothetical protein